jgi:hypothetical protein
VLLAALGAVVTRTSNRGNSLLGFDVLARRRRSALATLTTRRGALGLVILVLLLLEQAVR